MIKVGVTGGIGSGKTTVCEIFETLGAPVYYADTRAKYLMENDSDLKKEITSLFGEDAYTSGSLNRSYISKIVFEEKKKLEKLNGLVHPAVQKDSLEWMKNHSRHSYVLKEAALLVQSGAHKSLDFLILVTAPEEVRVKRVMERDGSSYEEVKSRINNQWTEDEMSAFADFSIINDGNHFLIHQVIQLHTLFNKLSKIEKTSGN